MAKASKTIRQTQKLQRLKDRISKAMNELEIIFRSGRIEYNDVGIPYESIQILYSLSILHICQSQAELTWNDRWGKCLGGRVRISAFFSIFLWFFQSLGVNGGVSPGVYSSSGHCRCGGG